MLESSSIGNPYTYTAREYDPETGLYYYRARYYNASIGVFISKDPIGFSAGSNLYSYVKNNPLKYTDPLGLHIRRNVFGSAIPHKHDNRSNDDDPYGLRDRHNNTPSESGLNHLPTPETDAINQELPGAIADLGIGMALGGLGEMYPVLAPFTDVLSNLPIPYTDLLSDLLERLRKNDCKDEADKTNHLNPELVAL